MIKDKVITGAIIGILADLVKLASNYIMYLVGLTPTVFWRITATRFLEKEDIYKPIALLIGGTADIIISSILGIVFVYFLYYTGKDYLWLKGVGFGLAVWVNLFGTLLGASVMTKIPQKPSSIIVTIIAHLIFGFALAFFAQKLYNQNQETT